MSATSPQGVWRAKIWMCMVLLALRINVSLELRELVPLILQAQVDEERQSLGEAGGALPTHSKSWEGVYHSIVRRAEKRATLQEVRLFVDEWLAANEKVLAFVTETIKEDPCCQYFA